MCYSTGPVSFNRTIGNHLQMLQNLLLTVRHQTPTIALPSDMSARACLHLHACQISPITMSCVHVCAFGHQTEKLDPQHSHHRGHALAIDRTDNVQDLARQGLSEMQDLCTIS